MKSIYIAGPITGRPWVFASDHFHANERRIRSAARESKIEIAIHNPVDICLPSYGWQTAMRHCIRELTCCHGIAMLRGWEKSKGAKIELALAQDLHIPVVYIEPSDDFMYINEIFTAAPEALRYYNARLLQFEREGVEESLAEKRAEAELVNRYLDPYGFEYIEISEE